MFHCPNDRYDPDGSQTYYNLEDFLAMCECVFNIRPKLTKKGTGYVDRYGDTVLVPAN